MAHIKSLFFFFLKKKGQSFQLCHHVELSLITFCLRTCLLPRDFIHSFNIYYVPFTQSFPSWLLRGDGRVRAPRSLSPHPRLGLLIVYPGPMALTSSSLTLESLRLSQKGGTWEQAGRGLDLKALLSHPCGFPPAECKG